MQPWLDAYEGGWTSVVVTDNDPALARRLAVELANRAWELRADFLEQDSVPIDVAVRRAENAPEGLIVLPDVGDTVWGGATGDSTWILEEMLRQRITSTCTGSHGGRRSRPGRRSRRHRERNHRLGRGQTRPGPIPIPSRSPAGSPPLAEAG